MSDFRLSQFDGIADMRILRDTAFSTTGKLSTPLDDLCVPLRSADYIDELNRNPRVAAVVTTIECADAVDERIGLAVAPDPTAAHYEIHVRCAEKRQRELRGRENQIAPSAHIDANANVAEHGVEIGEHCHIGPNVSIAPGVCLGDRVILHPGVSVGVPGFNTGIIGGKQRIIPQLGGVRIASNVELLSNCCIARASFGGDTTIGEETVADNLVYVAHDVQIGQRVQICALANILGRAWIGDNVYIGPSAVISNGIHIAADAKVSLGSVVTRNVAAGSTVTGNFAIGHNRFLKHLRDIR